MPSSEISFALAGSVLAAGLSFAPAPAKALGTLHTFQFDTAPPVSSPSASFSSTPEAGAASTPMNLTFTNARVSSNRVKDVSVTSEGVCLYKVGRRNSCGPNTNGRGRQSSIDLSFDKNVQLISYQYGLLTLGTQSANPTLVWTNQCHPALESNEGPERQVRRHFLRFCHPVHTQGFSDHHHRRLRGRSQRPRNAGPSRSAGGAGSSPVQCSRSTPPPWSRSGFRLESAPAFPREFSASQLNLGRSMPAQHSLRSS